MKKFLFMALMAIFCLTTASAQKTVVAKKNQKVYDVVEKLPEFPGGMEGMMKFFAENIKYPEDAKNKGVEGRVMVRFIVETDGSLSEVEVVQKAFPSLDAEAVRAVKAMPNWTSGMQKGKKVRVHFTIPVSFKLQ